MMQMHKKIVSIARFLKKENVIYVVMWTIAFIMPLVSHYMQGAVNGITDIDRYVLIDIYKGLGITLVAFIIHNCIASLAINRTRGALYVVLTLILIVLTMAAYSYIIPHHPHGDAPREEMRRGDYHGGNAEREGTEGEYKKREGESRIYKPRPILEPHAPDDGGGHKRGGRHFDDFLLGVNPKNIMNIAILIALFTINFGVKLFYRYENEGRRMRQLEEQSLKQQLAYLRYQIRPHFFMNTLNNIHALVDIDPEKAKYVVLELSKMMRYVLYESEVPMVPLEKELEFTMHYINLMKIRYTGNVKINVDIPDNLPDGNVPPLVLITFVENAFKHGVTYKRDCLINIKATADDEMFRFECSNDKTTEETPADEKGGVGLDNIAKRLKLIYGDKYSLDIDDSGDTFNVRLELPLKYEKNITAKTQEDND